MLGWLLLGALLTSTAIIIYVSYLDKKVAENKLKERNIRKGVIKDICESDNVTHIKIDAIDTSGNEQEVDIEAENYNPYEIRMGMVIVA